MRKPPESTSGGLLVTDLYYFGVFLLRFELAPLENLRLIMACQKRSVKERQHEKARNVGDFVEITPES